LKSCIQHTQTVDKFSNDDPELGDLVSVLGTLYISPWGENRRTLRADHMRRVADPNEESLHWLRIARLWRGCYRVEDPAVKEIAQEMRAVKTKLNAR
jgi:hypothetical protein